MGFRISRSDSAIHIRSSSRDTQSPPSGGHFPDVAPSETRLILGKFQMAGREQVRRAVTAAKEAVPVWNDLNWRNRISFLRKAADLMATHQLNWLLNLPGSRQKSFRSDLRSRRIGRPDSLLLPANGAERRVREADGRLAWRTNENRPQAVWCLGSRIALQLSIVIGHGHGDRGFAGRKHGYLQTGERCAFLGLAAI